MFRPRSMEQVEILLMRKDLAPSLRALAAARIIHLYRIDTGPLGRSPDHEEEELLSRYRAFSRRCDTLAENLDIPAGSGKLLDPGELSEWDGWCRKLQQRLDALRARQRQLRRCKLRLVALGLFLRRLPDTGDSFRQLQNLRMSSLRLGLLPLASLADPGGLPGGSRVYPLARLGDRTLVAILGLGRDERDLAKVLHSLAFVPIPLFHDVRGNLAEVSLRVRRLRRRLRARETALRGKIDTLRRENEGLLRGRRYTVEVEIQLLERRRDFGFTRRTVAIGGWVPSRRLQELREVLRAACSERFQVREAAARGEETPVLIFNPRLLRPFQKILSVYGTPSYQEIEPTPLLAFGFLLLFGMMFGDLGHGLVLVLAGLALRHWSRWRDEGLIMAEVGCFAALFGVLFGSVFGWEGLFHPLWFSPMSNIPRLMVTALVVGVVLMTGGMVLRVVNGLRQEPPAAVLTDRYGVAGIAFYLSGLVLGYLVYRGVLPPLVLALLFLPLAAIFLHPFTAAEGRDHASSYLLCAEGAIEVVETVLGFLANTFSFLRVAAFGLAHVGLSLAVFALAEQALTLPFGLVFAGFVHLFGNLLILALEGLVVSIQAVRLEFYEFFGKFFRGGGVRFSPLALDTAAERRL